MIKEEKGIDKWLSAALDDPNVCEDMKQDIREWFASKDVKEEHLLHKKYTKGKYTVEIGAMTCPIGKSNPCNDIESEETSEVMKGTALNPITEWLNDNCVIVSGVSEEKIKEWEQEFNKLLEVKEAYEKIISILDDMPFDYKELL